MNFDVKKKMVFTNRSKKDPGAKYFSGGVTHGERAKFEEAITLGALYHQLPHPHVRRRRAANDERQAFSNKR
ncbi:hypothetical protein AKJ63_00385 [candidate division MSBL1 archaeon SCGC-AAA259D18]|uniref:Uncharacterized protein n=1 Tax=candidate division MSBL1 archaeon SCGC-AAA259D18 TaxID=1698262 RepID=A0A133UCN0_9EURY|nr:hypothetical protein AKJ63_00385 [candidate division MSBL1 archaeon SCGC-AAA259D18]